MIPRQLRAAVLSAIVIVSIFALSSTAASAASDVSRSSRTVTLTAVSQGPGIQQTITCTINTQNPHKSSHVPGTINVITRTQCTAPVAGIASALGLYYNFAGSPVSSRSASNSGVAALQLNTTTPCVTGWYDALGLATVYFPPGYSPPSGNIGHWSNAVHITC